MLKLKYIAILFLITRLINLTILPIFIDEANYLDWGWRETHTPHFLFYSLYDAKPPGIMWLFGLAQNFVSDPLLAGRLVIVVFGLLTFIGLYFLSHSTSFLYLITPLFYFFDRQALMETPLSAVGVWSYYFLNRYLQHQKFKYLIFLGIILGLGLLVKTNASLFVVTALIILLFDTLKRKSLTSATSIIYLLMIILLTSSPLLFQAQFWSTLSKNSLYSFSLLELLHFPIISWFSNIWIYLQMAFWHLTPLVFLSLIIGLRQKNHIFYLWAAVPLLLLVLSSRNPLLRYLVPLLPIFLIPAADFLFRHRFYAIFSVFICIFVIGVLTFSPPSYFHILDFFTPYSQSSEYLTGRNTGYLVSADLAYFRQLPTPMIISFAVNSGNPEAAIVDYLGHKSGYITSYLDIASLGPQVASVDCLSSPTPFYFLARQHELAGLDKFLSPQITIKAPYTTDFHTIYTLKSDCPANKTFPLVISSSY